MAQAIQKLRPEYELSTLLSLANMSRSTFYYHCRRAENTDRYAAVKEAMRRIFAENQGWYGHRRLRLALRAEGYHVSAKKVLDLMRELGLRCLVRAKRTRVYRSEAGLTAPNLLKRNFSAAAPNQKWVTDVTEFRIAGEKLYLSPILDLYARDIVSYTIAERPVLSMVTSMVERAAATLPAGASPILHSDQGWQYRHPRYQRLLQERGLTQSMSRKGCCLDNAVIENFFGQLKSELLYTRTFSNMTEFRQALEAYLAYYNNRRIKARLRGLPPAAYRAQALG